MENKETIKALKVTFEERERWAGENLRKLEINLLALKDLHWGHPDDFNRLIRDLTTELVYNFTNYKNNQSKIRALKEELKNLEEETVKEKAKIKLGLGGEK